MASELEIKKSALKKYLYHRNKEIKDLDKINLQKCFFELLRECIKEREYIIEIGSYEFNIEPENLSVRYENEDTTIEISKDDVYFETTREPENRFFVISNKVQNEYSIETPAIRVSGIVNNIDGICEEMYQFDLFSPKLDKITNYINLDIIDENPNKPYFSDQDMESDYSIIVKRDIEVNYKRTDVYNLLKQGTSLPVIYDDAKDVYVLTDSEKTFIPSDYSMLAPSLEDKKNIISYLFNLILEFYTEYINSI